MKRSAFLSGAVLIFCATFLLVAEDWARPRDGKPGRDWTGVLKFGGYEAQASQTDSSGIAPESESAKAPATGAVSGSARTRVAGEPVWVTDFPGVDPSGTEDSTAGIQAAVTAGANNTIYFPSGIYKLSSPIVIQKNTVLAGSGGISSVLQFTHPGDGLQSTWPINSSTRVNITIRDLCIKSTHPNSTGAGFADVGGSYVHVLRNHFEGFAYGVIFDQTEVAEIESNEFYTASTAGIWLVNGDEHSEAAKGLYTNRITIRENQLNTGSFGIVDDGGYNHSIENNNFNAGSVQIRIAQPGVLRISGNEMESSEGSPILFAATKLDGKAAAAGTTAFVETNLIYPAAGQVGIRIEPSAIQQLNVYSNNFVTSRGIHGISGADNLRDDIADGLNASGNLQLGAGHPAYLLNTYLEEQDYVAAPVWSASIRNPAVGNGLLTAKWSRKGKEITVRYRLVIGSSTTPGEGVYSFSLPFQAAPGNQNFHGSGLVIEGSSSGITTIVPCVVQAGVTAQLCFTGGVVGNAAPFTFNAGDVIEFNVTYKKRGILE